MDDLGLATLFLTILKRIPIYNLNITSPRTDTRSVMETLHDWHQFVEAQQSRGNDDVTAVSKHQYFYLDYVTNYLLLGCVQV